MIKPYHILILPLLLWPGMTLADPIEEQIQLGLEAYQEQDHRGAIDELNYAIAQIQELLNAEYATLLPDPLEGWSAEDAETNSGGMIMAGAGTMLSRSYQRDDQVVDITLMTGSMVAAFLPMISNPAMLSNTPDTKAYRYKRQKGMIRETDREVEVTLALAGQIIVQVSGEDGETVESYLDALDLDAIKATLVQ